MTTSEDWFDRYVRDQGHDPGEPEPDLGIEKQPDRLITWSGVQVVCEIKQFKRDPFGEDWDGQPRTMSMKSGLKPVRGAIRQAAKQLKPLAGRGLPLVVVIANPKGVPVPLTNDEIVWALYGDPLWTIRIDNESGAPVGTTEHSADRNGQIRDSHQYLSAIVALRFRTNAQDWHHDLAERLKREHGFDPGRGLDEATRLARLAYEEGRLADERGEIPEGDYLFADVFVTMGREAEPLPANVFDGGRDTRWEYDLAAGTYGRVR